MAPMQNRQEILTLRRQAAGLIRVVLPDNLANLFDSLLSVSLYGSMSEAEITISGGDDYMGHCIDKLKRDFQRATSRSSKKDISELLTVEEAAYLTKVHPSTIYRMIRNKELGGVRFGRVVRVDPADLDALIARNKTDEP